MYRNSTTKWINMIVDIHQISLHLKSNDQEILDIEAANLAKHLSPLCTLNGPVLMPTIIDTYKVMRGKDRESISIRTYYRKLVAFRMQTNTLDPKKDFFRAIQYWRVPTGIDILIRIHDPHAKENKAS